MLAQMTSGVRLAAAVGMAVSLALPGLGAVSGVPSPGGYSPAAMTAEAGSGLVAYATQASATRRINLTVLDSATRAPIRGARVTGYWYTGPIRGPLPTGLTTWNGRAVITGPAQPVAYKWRIRIEAPGYVTEQFDRMASPGDDAVTRHLRRR